MNFIRNKTAFLKTASADEKLCYFLMFSIFLPYMAAAAVLLVVLVYLLIKAEYRKRIFAAKGSKWLAAFCVPLFLSPVLHRHWLGLAAGAGVMILLLLGIFIVQTVKHHVFEHCLDIAVFMSFPCAVAAYLQKIYFTLYPLKPGECYRSTSCFFNPNYYGTIIEFISLICIYKLLSRQSASRRIYYFLALLCNYAALYFADSFSAWAAIGVAASAILLFTRHYKALAGVLTAGVIVVMLVLLIPDILPRMSFVDSTFSIRFHIWQRAFSAFLENPLIGLGSLGYWVVSQDEVRGLLIQPHAHNIVLDTLLNYGILGTSCLGGFFYCQYGCHFKAALKSKYKPAALFTAAVVVSVVVHGITDVTVFYHQTGLLLLFLLSGTALAEKEEEPSVLAITGKMYLGLERCPDAVDIRTEVFIKEQGFTDEFDGHDAAAWHVVLYSGETPIATGRMFLQEGQYIIGRVAVRKEYRHLHVGSAVIHMLEEKIGALGGTSAKLSAQVQARGFYEKLGYRTESEECYYDEHCPHIEMKKSLAAADAVR